MGTVAGSILTSGNILLITGHEIISTAILSLQLIQEGQLSVTGESAGKLPRRLTPEQYG